MPFKIMPAKALASLLLRIGIAFSFLYAAFSAYQNPLNWVGFLPQFLVPNLEVGKLMLSVFGIIEVLVSLILIFNFKTFYAALISALMIAGIIIFNLGAFDLTFRDVPILFGSLALAVLARDKQ